MGRTSKFKLKSAELEELEQHFSYLISSLSSSKEIGNFFNNFLTKEEKIMLTKRLALLMMIKMDYPYQEIKNALNISYETVRTYSNQLPLKNDSYHKTIEKLIRRQKSKEFWKKADKVIRPLELALKSKTDMKARADLIRGGRDY